MIRLERLHGRTREAALGLFALAALGLSGCGSHSTAPAGSSAAAGSRAKSDAKELVVGFIYVGPRDDFGYNQTHAQGAAAVKKMPGVVVREEERVQETVDVQKAMTSMIEIDGAKLLFPTSYGYFDPHVLKVAKEHPEVTFLHCGGLWREGKHPKNVGSYFGYMDECQYLCGIVAGHTTKTKKLGYVASKPIPVVKRNINAFVLGARSVDPSITCQVIFTGDWWMPVKEAEAANALIDQNVDVLTSHVDSPKVVVETAERRGIYSSGFHCSQAALAPKGYLTGAEWNWEKVYTDYVTLFKEGKPIPNLVRGGLKEGIIKLSPYGPAVGPEARKAADDVKKQFVAGSFVIFKGPLKDNTGKEILPEGKEYVQTAPELEGMQWLVDGVIGR